MPKLMAPTKICSSLVCVGCLLAPMTSGAITIDATLASLGGNSYRFDYTMTNDGSLGAGVSIESFDISFLDSLITGWTEIGVAAGDWDEFSGPVASDDFFGADLISGSGIAVGASESFSVSFDWSGIGLPASQKFTIYDLATYGDLEIGQTTVAASSVPVPATLSLFAVPMLLMARRRT